MKVTHRKIKNTTADSWSTDLEDLEITVIHITLENNAELHEELGSFNPTKDGVDVYILSKKLGE